MRRVTSLLSPSKYMQFCNGQIRTQALFWLPCASPTYGSARVCRRKNSCACYVMLTLPTLNGIVWSINSLRPRPNRRHFADDIFKCIFENENEWISPRISLKFIVPKVRINNIPALFQIMAWCWTGDKPLSEPMMVSLLTHICVTRPQWVNRCTSLLFHGYWGSLRCRNVVLRIMCTIDKYLINKTQQGTNCMTLRVYCTNIEIHNICT